MLQAIALVDAAAIDEVVAGVARLGGRPRRSIGGLHAATTIRAPREADGAYPLLSITPPDA